MESAAVYSPCRTYRYALWRIWTPAAPRVLFIGLNPSTADVTHNDPTARRCIGFAQRWGYGGVYLANLFAYQATQPAQMKAASEPVGEKTDIWLDRLTHWAALTVVAWGNHGHFLGRDRTVLARLGHPYCLSITRQGQPAHPLYLRADCPLRPYRVEVHASQASGGRL